MGRRKREKESGGSGVRGQRRGAEGVEGEVTINRTLSLIEKLKLLDFNTKTKGEKEKGNDKTGNCFLFQGKGRGTREARGGGRRSRSRRWRRL